MRTWGCLATLCLVTACGESSFSCSDDEQCARDGGVGFCELDGYCSFPDDECNSGRRYGGSAPAGVAGTCVTTMGGSGVTGVPTGPSSAGGTDSTSGGATTAETLEEGSTGATSQAEDASSSDGAAESSTGPAAEPNVVFVSSKAVALGPGMVERADDLCVELAAEAGLSGTYVAWLTSSSIAAVSRIQGARGWVRTDGAVFVDTVSDLAMGFVYHPPLLDESGQVVRDVRVVTGTNADGSAAKTCSDWSVFDQVGEEYAFGRPGATWPHWTQWGEGDCAEPDAAAHVYCFGVDHEAAPSVTSVPGRRAFVSVSTKDGDGGLASFDAICEQESVAAGLRGSFKAFVATDDDPPIARFDAFGEPWVNMLGVPLVSVASDLLALEHIDVPPNVSATGVPVPGFFWTGSRSPSLSGSQNFCNGWTGAGFGLHYPTSGTTDWLDYSVTQCGNQHHVLCFEE
ncbi:MAG: hypothetical protein AAGA54_12825 [Myxococcota bacterium]